MTHARVRPVLAACWLAVVGFGCAGSEPHGVGEPLLLVTEAQLDGFDPEVATQLRDAAGEASKALADRGRPADERAAAVGRLGQLYQTYDLAAAAERCYDEARRLDPEAWRWAYLSAIVREMSGRSDAAAEAFDDALALSPDDLPTLVRAAAGRLDRNELDRARELYERALEVEPSSTPALWGLGRVALRRGDAATAIELVERALAIEPQADRLYATLAEAYRRAGDRDGARAHAARQGTVDPTLDDPLLAELTALRTGVGAHMARGYDASAAGRQADAVAAYERAVASDPDNPEARRGLAGALASLGRRDEALVQYRHALALEPDSAMAHYNVAVNLPPEGAHEAIELLDRAVELAPDVDEFRLERLGRLTAVGELDVAADGYSALLEVDPESLGATWGLARVTAARGDLDGALALYGAILDRELDDSVRAEAHVERGRLLSAARRGDAGLIDFERALGLEPGYLDARFALANTLGMTGRYDEAAAEYATVLAAEPEHLGARLGEATALALAGRLDEAKASVERGLVLTPEEPALIAALRQLQEGGV